MPAVSTDLRALAGSRRSNGTVSNVDSSPLNTSSSPLSEVGGSGVAGVSALTLEIVFTVSLTLMLLRFGVTGMGGRGEDFSVYGIGLVVVVEVGVVLSRMPMRGGRGFLDGNPLCGVLKSFSRSFSGTRIVEYESAMGDVRCSAGIAGTGGGGVNEFTSDEGGCEASVFYKK